MGPQNGVVGDENFGTELPRTQVVDEQLNAEKRMATFTKSQGYQELEAFVKSRIDYYQKYLPGDVPAENVPDEERGKYWAISNIVIREFQGILNAYENAKETVSKAKKGA